MCLYIKPIFTGVEGTGLQVNFFFSSSFRNFFVDTPLGLVRCILHFLAMIDPIPIVDPIPLVGLIPMVHSILWRTP